MTRRCITVAVLLALIISVVFTGGCVRTKKADTTIGGDIKVGIDARNASSVGSLE